MNLLSIVMFGHVAGMIGLFVALGLEGAGIVRSMPDLETPRLYRVSVALLVLTGAYLARGLLAGSSPSIPALGWLVVSVPALAIVAGTGMLPAARRRRIYAARTALSVVIVYLMIAEPPLTISVLAALVGITAGLVSNAALGPAHVAVKAAVDR
jgi:hypothetical protein